MEPVEGGDSPYLQQQNYSLEALAKRDAASDPFAPAGGGAAGNGAGSQDGAPDAAGDGEPAQGDGQDGSNTSRAAFADQIMQFSRYHARRSIGV